jgi:quercetin dioxygenase-like cupin family protein
VEHWNLTEIDAPNGTRDAVVLRQDDGGRAILIAIQPGQALGDHQVKEDAWLTVVEGSVRIEAGGEQVEAGVGALFRFDPDERRSVASDGARGCCSSSPRSPGRATSAATTRKLLVCSTASRRAW